MRTPPLLSFGTRAMFMLGIFIFSMSVVVMACETNIPPSTRNTETTTVTKMKRAFVPGEALVKFKFSVSQERMDAVLKEAGTELITVIKGIEVHHVRIVGNESVDTVVKRLSTFQEVEYAEPNALSQTNQ